jgi:elongation factor Ts
LKTARIGDATVEETRAALIAKVGENVQLRRLARIDSSHNVAGYVHGGRIGVLVELKGGDAELAKGIAMHIEILEKIISGKIAKIVNEVTLTGQPYALDTDKTVDAVLKAANAEVLRFHRLAVGEGIEKVVEDYAAEVMKQAGLA